MKVENIGVGYKFEIDENTDVLTLVKISRLKNIEILATVMSAYSDILTEISSSLHLITCQTTDTSPDQLIELVKKELSKIKKSNKIEIEINKNKDLINMIATILAAIKEISDILYTTSIALSKGSLEHMQEIANKVDNS